MKRLSALIGLLLLPLSLYCVSAFPGVLTFTQNDGGQFKGTLRGDEWLNYVSLPNDYVAIYNKDSKNYEYALIEVKDGKSSLVTSGQKVDEALHLNNPQELQKTIPPLDISILSKLDRKSREDIFSHTDHKKDHNKSNYKHKVLKTKSTQWKEILKEEEKDLPK